MLTQCTYMAGTQEQLPAGAAKSAHVMYVCQLAL